MNIAIDFSDLAVYIQDNNRPSGVERVVYNLTQKILELEPKSVNVVFCDPLDQRFYQVDPGILLQKEFSGARLRDALDIANRRSSVDSKYKGRAVKGAFHKLQHELSILLKGRGQLRGINRWVPGPGITRYAVLGLPYVNPSLDKALASLVDQHRVEPVILIHDLRPLLASKLEAVKHHPMVPWFSSGIYNYRRFFVYSSYTGEKLTAALQGHPVSWIRHFNLPHEFESNSCARPAIMSNYADQEFVVTVGSLRQKHKNADNILRAWAILSNTYGSRMPKLVFAGAHGAAISRLERARRRYPSLTDKLIAVNEPDDAQLAWLYRNCIFSTFPSLYEGWGLPVGESAWIGKFCVASNRTSIPEVLGSAADYFDPENIADMVAVLERPIIDRNYLALRQNGLRLVALRSWEMSAKELYKNLQNPD